MLLKRKLFFCASLFYVLLIAGTGAIGATIQGNNSMEIDSRHSIQENNSLNEFSLKEIQTISRVIKAMSRVIANVSTLEKEKNVLLNIRFTYPKDPKKTITSASFHFSISNGTAAGGFERENDKLPWNSGDLLVAQEQNVYRMGLTKYFFVRDLGLEFDNAVLEKRESAPLPAYHVFYFHKKVGDLKLKFAFETRPDVSELDSHYPKSFHQVTITNTH